jgi:hypothetical protein
VGLKFIKRGKNQSFGSNPGESHFKYGFCFETRANLLMGFYLSRNGIVSTFNITSVFDIIPL